MPVTDTQPSLPWSGKTPTSRHCSHQAAVSAAQTRVYKSHVYVEWLLRMGRLSDHQAADDLGWPLSSICSIRNGLVDRGKVEVAGTIEGKYGKRVTLWRVVLEPNTGGAIDAVGSNRSECDATPEDPRPL